MLHLFGTLIAFVFIKIIRDLQKAIISRSKF